MKISSLRNQWVSISIRKRLSISALLFVLISVLVLYFSPNNITTLKHEITKHVEATRQKSLQNNDRIYKSYSSEQRKIIEHHALRAVSNLKDAENKVLIALAVSHYTFNYVNATPAPKSKNGVDVMQTREANCGGSISMASDMLNFLGIKSIPVYGVGGVQFAHSMLEVVIPEQANILIDPFAGVAFTKNGLYLSFEKALEFSQDKTVVPLYALPQRDKEAQPIPLTDVDSSYSKVKNAKTRLPSSTQELGHYYLAGHKISGVAGSGQIDTVFIKVQPGDVFGEPGWKSRKVRPYQALAQSKDQNGNKVGWAHMLGQRSFGYRVNHSYQLQNLKVGHTYVMILEVAYAYKSLRENWMDNTMPTISFAMAYPQTAARHISVKRTVHKQDDYSPQLIKYPFVAEKVEQVLNLNATGNITLGAIYLKENF